MPITRIADWVNVDSKMLILIEDFVLNYLPRVESCHPPDGGERQVRHGDIEKGDRRLCVCL